MQATGICGKQTVNLFLTVLEIVAPVFLLAAVGFVWVKSGGEYRIAFVTRLGMTHGCLGTLQRIRCNGDVPFRYATFFKGLCSNCWS